MVKGPKPKYQPKNELSDYIRQVVGGEAGNLDKLLERNTFLKVENDRLRDQNARLFEGLIAEKTRKRIAEAKLKKMEKLLRSMGLDRE